MTFKCIVRFFSVCIINFDIVNWANTLYRNARMVEDDAENYGKLLSMSAAKYAKSLQIKDSNMDALYNWGKALKCQARIKNFDTSTLLNNVQQFTLQFKAAASACKFVFIS